MSIKIGINGFGRIGRSLARLILENGEFDLVAVNDPTDLAMSAYLLKYDSVHRRSSLDVETGDDTLRISKKNIRYTRAETIEATDFSGCDIVFECSGRYMTSDLLAGHLKNGVKKVILSSMPQDTTPVFVMGLSAPAVLKESIISAGSCSTNALALILSCVEKCGDIESGSVTSVHSYTTDQNIVDGKNARGGLRSARAADLNIIPVPTGVAKNLSHVLPHLADRMMGFSVRVPVPNVTMLDITLSMQNSVTIEAIRNALEDAAKGRFKKLLSLDHEAKVSSDFVSSDATVTVATDLTQMTGEKSVKIIGWFDNETGYTSRLYDLISLLKESI